MVLLKELRGPDSDSSAPPALSVRGSDSAKGVLKKRGRGRRELHRCLRAGIVAEVDGRDGGRDRGTLFEAAALVRQRLRKLRYLNKLLRALRITLLSLYDAARFPYPKWTPRLIAKTRSVRGPVVDWDCGARSSPR